ncbi:MAG: alanine racemase [Synergistaceae bacterium]|jgi:predicted amino acid racemase|nr:alanine racemase [Synergistaceae bacterium]
MKYPALTICRSKVLSNACKVRELCSKKNIEVWGVTKGLSGDPRLADIYREAGFAGISDSRSLNLKKIRDSGNDLPRQLMRIAMRSELAELPGVADVSLQSEVSTILELDRVCSSLGVFHETLIMVDIGDLREGFWPNDLVYAGEALSNISNVSITGIAANFACASGVLPTMEKLDDLARYSDVLRESLGRNLPNISIGGTSCLKLLEGQTPPSAINQLRICEGVLLGKDTAFMREIPYLDGTALAIHAEIVECKLKPSVPSGELGLQAFGEKPVFLDRGTRKRALLGIGRQDVNIDRLTPMQDGVSIITASSDHMIVDVTDAASLRKDGCQPGDVLSFRPLYPAMLAAATSEYVSVVFEDK